MYQLINNRNPQKLAESVNEALESGGTLIGHPFTFAQEVYQAVDMPAPEVKAEITQEEITEVIEASEAEKEANETEMATESGDHKEEL